MTDQGYRCGHAACVCSVPSGEQYCSSHCADAATRADPTPHACDCGHEVCRYSQHSAQLPRQE